jgi:lipoprotein NlpD
MAVTCSGTKGWAALGVTSVWAALVAGGIAGCSTALTPAPITDMSTGGSATAPQQASASAGTSVAAPVASAPAPLPPAGAGFYRVKPGDTLYGIARAQKQRPSDLIKWNNLPASLQVNIDQLLRVAPPGAPGTSAGSTASADDWSKSASASASGTASGSASGTTTKGATGIVEPDGGSGASTSASSGSSVSSKGAWLLWPASGDIITKFGEGGSKGIDIGGKLGEPVKAAAAGRVVYAGTGLRAYGPMIIVKHNNDYLSAYAHNGKLLVKEGDMVKQGTTIAEMGSGPNNKPLLHFELRKSGQAVDPVPSLKRAGG